MHAQKTQNTAAFEVPLCVAAGRRYEYALKSMLKRQCLVTFKGTTSELGKSVDCHLRQDCQPCCSRISEPFDNQDFIFLSLGIEQNNKH